MTSKPSLRGGKEVALSLAARSGLLRQIRNSQWRRERLAILCYHGFSVADEGAWLPDYYVTAAHLRKRLEFLREEGYVVLGLGEAVERLGNGSLPPRSVAITIDDGSADFYQVAAPIFEEFSVPVTLYLTTFHCFSQTPIFHFFANYLLWKGRGSTAPLPVLGAGLNLQSAEVRGQASAHLREHASQNRLSQPARGELLRQLAKAMGVDFELAYRQRLCQLITPAEGRDLIRRGFDLQLHTHRHRSPADQSLFLREIEENRRLLVEELGASEAVHFCYPSGEYRPEFVSWLDQLGVRTATTCENNLASAQSHPLLLPRFIDTTSVSTANFASRVAGLVIRPQEQKRVRRPQQAGE